MKRDRKISVTFFLNKNVKPDSGSVFPFQPEIKRYPLYLQVTYNRRNTQFRSFYRCHFAILEQAFASKEEKEHRKYEESLIKKVIEYEIKHLGKDFQLKGISDRYLDYSDSIINSIDKYFRNIIYDAVAKVDSEFFKILNPWNLQGVPYEIYYKAAIKLHPDLDQKLPSDFPEELNLSSIFLDWINKQKVEIRLIDWLDRSAIITFESYLIKKRYSKDQIKTLISFINRILKLSAGLIVY